MESTQAQRMNFWWSTTQFVICTVFAANFLYFTVVHSMREAHLEARCIAKVGINHPIKITANTNIEEITDVGNQFFVTFIFGFMLSVITAVWSVGAIFLSQRSQLKSQTLGNIISLANFIYLLSVTCLRFCHAGKVCSGDYLYYPIQQESIETSVLADDGMFLTIFIFSGWLMNYITLLIALVIFCCDKAKNSPDQERYF